MAPQNLPVRPTTDMAKESLFNILNNHFDLTELDVLDLFSGTGNIAYEFASRNCKSIAAVDIDKKCIRFIQQTAEKLNFENFKTFQSDYNFFLKSAYHTWDLIFADPPYDMKDIIHIPELVFEYKLLNKNGWLVIEHDRNHDFSALHGFHDHRTYGKVNFSFFKQNC